MFKLIRNSVSFVNNKLFGKYLLLTNTVSGGVMMLTGDYIQQRIERYRGKSEEYNLERATHMGALGIVFAPLAHFFYKYMEIFLPKKDARTVMKKLVLDQVTVAPSYIIIFFCGVNFLEGRTAQDAWKELKEKFFTAYFADCILWMPCQAINFFFLPARYRVLYVNFILVGYDGFLSYIKYRDQLPVIEDKKTK